MNGQEPAWLGIDPGVTGAMALISYHGELRIHDFESIPAADDCIRQWQTDFYVIGAALEHVRPFRDNGSIANFKLGQSLGLWEAILYENSIGMTLVAPATWQKHHAEYKKDSGIGGKKRSLAAIHRLYPHSSDFVYYQKHHNRADALLLAHHARTVAYGN